MAEIYTERQQHLNLCSEALAWCWLTGRAPEDALGEDLAIEAKNLISSHQFARKKDTPAKDWWHCDATNPAIARALRIDKKQYGAVYALQPFRLFHDGARHLILAAYPCPRILGPVDMDWLEIETVFAWDPIKDTCEVLGDHTPGLFGVDLKRVEKPIIFSSPRDFFTQWMIDRAAYFARRAKVGKSHWHTMTEYDVCPGKLAIGPIDKINWRDLPHEFEARGFDTQKLNRTILRQARVPRAFTGKAAA